MNTTSSVVGIVVVILIGLGAWWYVSQPAAAPAPQQQASATPNDQGQPDTSVSAGVSATVTTGVPMSATVTYGPNGFSPSTITIAKGGTVTFAAAGAPQMWVASAPHPAHTGYDGTSRSTHCAAAYKGAKPFDQCSSGTNFVFTFNQAGTWGYHDHLNASAAGTVIVK